MAFWWSVAFMVTAGAAPPELEKAEALVAAYKYAEATGALTKARAVKGLERPALLRTLELTGIVYGQLRKTPQAEAAFRELLVLDPNHALGADYAPRVMTPFFAARQSVAEQGALSFTAAAPELTTTAVSALVVDLKDPTDVGRSVRFHLARAAQWVVTSVNVSNGKARLPVEVPEARWWAELRGANGEQLALVGSEQTPLVARPLMVDPPPPKVIVEVPQVVAPTPQSATVTRSSGTRTSSYFFLGAAALAGGFGVYFGLQSAQGFTTYRRVVNETAPIRSMTEKDAAALGQTASRDGTLANALFAGSGVLAVTAVVLWLVGAPVEVTPTTGGLALAVNW